MNLIKRRFAQKIVSIFMVLGLSLGLTACGSSGDSGDGAASIQSIEGSWVGTVEFDGRTFTVDLKIVQSGVNLTATTESTDGAGGGGTHAYTGTIDGSTVYLVSVESGVKREYNLSLVSLVVLSGTYIPNDGTPSPTTFNKI